MRKKNKKNARNLESQYYFDPGRTNTLGIVVFCLTFGTILGTIGEKGQVVVSFFAAIFEVVMKMVIITCLWISPIGISSVIAGKILDVENLNLIISQLLMFIITVVSSHEYSIFKFNEECQI